MKKHNFMNSREAKQFFKQIEEQYGEVPKDFKEKAFMKSKEKIYLITREIGNIDLDALRINSIGLYIAEIKHDQLRVSIEGSQLIGPSAKKNVCEISEEQVKDWFQGRDIQVPEEYEGFVILKHDKDFIGSGKFKEGAIMNFVPKARRLIEVH